MQGGNINMNLQEKFTKEIAGQLKKELGIKINMALPKLLKIVVNMGVKDALLDKKSVEKEAGILAQI